MAVNTLLQLRTQVRQRANMENSQFVTDAELNSYINLAIAELYDLMVSKYGEDYFFTSYDLPLQIATEAYTLPTDFYKLLGVDLMIDATRKIRLRRFEFAERNRVDYALTLREIDLRYRLRGNTIIFSPITNVSQRTIRISYIPRYVYLGGDTDTFDGYNGWEEYVIVRAAIKCLMKEESDVSALAQELMLLEKRIEAMADNRDAQSPTRVYDNNTIWEFYDIWP